MANKKKLLLTPILIAGSTILPQYVLSQSIFDSNLKNEITVEINDDWIAKVIDYYYANLENEISSIQNDLGFENIKTLTGKTTEAKINSIKDFFKKQCEDFKNIIKKRTMVFPIDRSNFFKSKLPVTSFYGPRKHDGYNIAFLHQGIDVTGLPGTAILSPFSGYIVKTEEESNNNIYTILIYHGNGLYTRWAHVNPVKSHGFVNAGETFARIKYRSMLSTGPHAHFEVIIKHNGKFYNINIMSINYQHRFLFIDKGNFVDEITNSELNLTIKMAYFDFITEGSNFYKKIIKKDYFEANKTENILLDQYFKNNIVKEKLLEQEIAKEMKKHFVKNFMNKFMYKYNGFLHSSGFLKNVLKNVINSVFFNLSNEEILRYEEDKFEKSITASLKKYYPELLYENFQSFFLALNVQIFSKVIDEITGAGDEIISSGGAPQYIKEVVLNDERFKNILNEKYAIFSSRFKEHLNKIFFLNLGFYHSIKSLNDLKNNLNNKNPAFIEHTKLILKKLKQLDSIIVILENNKDKIFESIINSEGFRILINSIKNDLIFYVKDYFKDYIKIISSEENALNQDDLITILLEENNEKSASFLSSISDDTTFKPIIKCKLKDNKVLIFFQSPGHLLGNKIYSVKLIREIRESALFLIEQKTNAGKEYRIQARFYPVYNPEFDAKGFCFEILKDDKMVYLKNHNDFCMSKNFVHINELNSLFIGVTLSPVLEKEEDRADVIKKLIKSFEYSFPVDFKGVLPD